MKQTAFIRGVALSLAACLAGGPVTGSMGPVGAGFHPRPQSKFHSIQSIQISGGHGGPPLQFSFASQALASEGVFEEGSLKPAAVGSAVNLGAARAGGFGPAGPARYPFNLNPELALETGDLGRIFVLADAGQNLSAPDIAALADGLARVEINAFKLAPEQLPIQKARFQRSLQNPQLRQKLVVLISPIGTVQGYAEIADDVETKTSRLDRIAVQPEDGPPDQGSYLLKALMARWKTRNLESVKLVATWASVGFYHHLLSDMAPAVDYTYRSRDRVFGDRSFVLYPRTYGELTPAQRLTQQAYRAKFVRRRERVNGLLQSLPAGRYVLNFMDGQIMEVERLTDGSWRHPAHAQGIKPAPGLLYSNLVAALVYDQLAMLHGRYNADIVIPASGIEDKRRVTDPSESAGIPPVVDASVLNRPVAMWQSPRLSDDWIERRFDFQGMDPRGRDLVSEQELQLVKEMGLWGWVQAKLHPDAAREIVAIRDQLHKPEDLAYLISDTNRYKAIWRVVKGNPFLEELAAEAEWKDQIAVRRLTRLRGNRVRTLKAWLRKAWTTADYRSHAGIPLIAQQIEQVLVERRMTSVIDLLGPQGLTVKGLMLLVESLQPPEESLESLPPDELFGLDWKPILSNATRGVLQEGFAGLAARMNELRSGAPPVSVPQFVSWLTHQSLLDLGSGRRREVVQWLRERGARDVWALNPDFAEDDVRNDPLLVPRRMQDPWPFESGRFRVLTSFFSLGHDVTRILKGYARHWSTDIASDYRAIAGNMARVTIDNSLIILALGSGFPNNDLEAALRSQGMFVERERVEGFWLVTKQPLDEVLGQIADEIHHLPPRPVFLAGLDLGRRLKPAEMRRFRRPEPYLPEERQMKALARKEEAAVRSGVSYDDSFFMRMRRVDRDFGGWMIFNPAMIYTKDHLGRLARSMGLSFERLLHRLRLPPWTKQLMVTKNLKEDYFPFSRKRRLLEELFHALMGVDLGRRQVGDDTYREIMEAVNDVLQLMLYPADHVMDFYASYTNWSRRERLALLAHYRDRPGRDVNYAMDDIIRAIREDIRDGAEIRVGRKTIRVIDLLFGHILGWKPAEEVKAKRYMAQLVKSERFSRHQPLFPGRLGRGA